MGATRNGVVSISAARTGAARTGAARVGSDPNEREARAANDAATKARGGPPSLAERPVPVVLAEARSFLQRTHYEREPIATATLQREAVRRAQTEHRRAGRLSTALEDALFDLWEAERVPKAVRVGCVLHLARTFAASDRQAIGDRTSAGP